MILRLFLIFVALIMLLSNLTCVFAEEFEPFLNKNCFDKYFQKFTKKHFGSYFDWRYFKAQAIAESRLYPDARSAKEARGLMQILPSTFQEIIRKNPDIQGQITDPHSNIEAGIYYNKVLWDEWSADRNFKDRINFMFGSYNAGKHTILQAQKIAMEKGLDPYSWSSIVGTLPSVNGDRSRETIAYVGRIHKIKEVLHTNAAHRPQPNRDVAGSGGRCFLPFPAWSLLSGYDRGLSDPSSFHARHQVAPRREGFSYARRFTTSIMIPGGVNRGHPPAGK